MCEQCAAWLKPLLTVEISHEWKDCIFFTTTTLGFINSQDLMPKTTGGSHIWVALTSYSSYLIKEEKAVDASSTDGFLVMKASPSSYDLGTKCAFTHCCSQNILQT